MDLDLVDHLRERHPAWRLLRARNAPLVLSFLGGHFIEANHGPTASGHLTAALDDVLLDLHRTDPDRYPSEPQAYLDDWSGTESGWLRRYYPADSDEIHYDATPALERAYRWVEGLQARSFVGTESRLHTLVELLRQIVHGTQEDPAVRLAELQRRRTEIDEEIAQVKAGNVAVMDETAVRDRYQQFSSTARELLSDFREVEENFRALDRSAREKIASWDGGKGGLLAELVGSRTDIAASDQGRSFQAFYDFLLSEDRQDELAGLLAQVQAIPRIGADQRLRTVHHDWSDAAERTQQTVRNLSEQLRRFLEDRVWLENRRVLDLVRAIEANAIAVRNAPPPDSSGVGLEVDQPGVAVALPFERPLYDTVPASAVDSLIAPEEPDPAEINALLEQRFVDTARLVDNILAVVPPRSTAVLSDVVLMYPVEQGVAEIVGYLSLGDQEQVAVDVDDTEQMVLEYTDPDGVPRRVTMPKVTVTRR